MADRYRASPQSTGGLPPVSQSDRERLLTDTLKGVSRAFYLTLRVLPGSLREPMGLAYLLARAADTIADTRALPPEARLRHLLDFRRQVDGPAQVEAVHEIERSLIDSQTDPREGTLLRSLPQALSVLEEMPEDDCRRVRSIVVTLTQGMEFDLTRFPPEDSGRVRALDTLDDLDRYTYYVAGCVGEFWTAMSVAHVGSLRQWDEERMSALGVRFGKALQLTNVLRDVPADLRIGRCYLPQSELSPLGLSPEDLLDSTASARARSVIQSGIRLALDHYQAAQQYLLAIPRRSVRLRLAVLWPILIGLATLERLARNPAWLDPAQPSRVSRRWVYRMMALSIPCVLSNAALKLWIDRLRRRALDSL